MTHITNKRVFLYTSPKMWTMPVLKCLQRPQREWETDEKSKETLIAAFRVFFFFKSMMRAVIDVSTLISNLMIAALALSWKSGFSPKQSLENSLPCEVTNVHHFRDRKKKMQVILNSDTHCHIFSLNKKKANNVQQVKIISLTRNW